MKIQLVYKNQSSELDFDGDVLIGKSTQCDLQLKGWFIAAKHALLRSTPNGVLIQDLERGTNGTYVNGKRIDYYGPIKFDDDVIEIAGYSIKILSDQQIEVPVDSIEPANTIVSIESQKSTNDLYIVWLKKIHQLLVEKMDLRRKDVSKMSDEEFRAETTEVLDKILTDQLSEFPHALQMAKLKKMVLDEAIGLGPLEDLLSDDSVSEIMVNAKDEIFIERHGLIVQSGLVFSSNRAVIDMFEPGSTMKVLTVAAALESGKYTPESKFNTHPGTMQVLNHLVRDHEDYGVIDLGTIITKSSNVGVTQIALSLPREGLPTFFQRFGFGKTTGSGFPGESRGLMQPPNAWNPVELSKIGRAHV